jgi:hypothetical protein
MEIWALRDSNGPQTSAENPRLADPADAESDAVVAALAGIVIHFVRALP